MSEPHKSIKNRKTQWLEIIPPLIPLTMGFTLISSMLDDDAYITFWSAHILAETGEIVNYNGDRVEQSSSLAFVVLLAIFVKLLPIVLPTFSPLLSGIFGAGTVFLTQRLMSQLNPALSIYAGLLVGSATSLIVWSVSGMEATFLAFLAVWYLLTLTDFIENKFTIQKGLLIGTTTVLYLMARPESVFVIISVLLALIALLFFRLKLIENANREEALVTLQRARTVILFTILAATVLGIFRHLYFGDWFPQPVSAKISGLSRSKLIYGINYMLDNAWLNYDSAIWILGLMGISFSLFRSVKETRLCYLRTLVMLFTASYASFILFSGGDWMIGGRFLVPLLPGMVIMALEILQFIKPARLMKLVIGLMVSIQIFTTFAFARNESFGGPIWAAEHVNYSLLPDDSSWFEQRQRHTYHDIAMTTQLDNIIQKLRTQKGGEKVSILSGQMGQVMFYVTSRNYGHLHVIDRYALVTRDFTSCPITASNPRFSVGLIVSYDFFFEHSEEIEKTCSIKRPDIIWDWGSSIHNKKSIEEKGYSIVYWQDGFVINGSEWFPGSAVKAREFIAVRNDLLNDELPETIYDFSSGN
ncbi:MAG: hypothetical protein GY796_31845 [Chloroflexi bacterium]|nr:hypothetical protein [Chloroflexota bacterium]